MHPCEHLGHPSAWRLGSGEARAGAVGRLEGRGGTGWGRGPGVRDSPVWPGPGLGLPGRPTSGPSWAPGFPSGSRKGVLAQPCCPAQGPGSHILSLGVALLQAG